MAKLQKIDAPLTVADTRRAVASSYMQAQQGMSDVLTGQMSRLGTLIRIHAKLESHIVKVIETGMVEGKTKAGKTRKRALTTAEIMGLHATLEGSIRSIFVMFQSISRETQGFMQTEIFLKQVEEMRGQLGKLVESGATMENVLNRLPKVFRDGLAAMARKKLLDGVDGEFVEIK